MVATVSPVSGMMRCSTVLRVIAAEADASPFSATAADAATVALEAAVGVPQ